MRPLALLLFFALTAFAHAEDLPPTLLTQRGKLLHSDDFDHPIPFAKGYPEAIQKGIWRFAVGAFEFADGGLHVASRPEDHHSANALLPLKFGDAIVQVDVRLDGAKQVLLLIDDPMAMRPPTPTRPAHETPEHICRVTVTPGYFSTQKDDHDHDGPDQAVPFGTAKLALPPGTWRTLLLEMRGAELVATMDGHSLTGSDPLISIEKGYISFGCTGATGSFRRLRLWEALPNPAWPATKAALAGKK